MTIPKQIKARNNSKKLEIEKNIQLGAKLITPLVKKLNENRVILERENKFWDSFIKNLNDATEHLNRWIVITSTMITLLPKLSLTLQSKHRK